MRTRAHIDIETVGLRDIAAMLGACPKTVRKHIRTKRLNLEPVQTVGEILYDLNDVRREISNFKPPRPGRPKTDSAK